MPATSAGKTNLGFGRDTVDVLIRLLLRFILVPLGAALALAAAAAFIVIAHRNAMLAVLDADPQAQQEYFVAFLFAGPMLALLLSIWAFYMFVPAAIGVLISEAFAVRSWMFHAANGGLSAVARLGADAGHPRRVSLSRRAHDSRGRRACGGPCILDRGRVDGRVLETDPIAAPAGTAAVLTASG